MLGARLEELRGARGSGGWIDGGQSGDRGMSSARLEASQVGARALFPGAVATTVRPPARPQVVGRGDDEQMRSIRERAAAHEVAGQTIRLQLERRVDDAGLAGPRRPAVLHVVAPLVGEDVPREVAGVDPAVLLQRPPQLGGVDVDRSFGRMILAAGATGIGPTDSSQPSARQNRLSWSAMSAIGGSSSRQLAVPPVVPGVTGRASAIVTTTTESTASSTRTRRARAMIATVAIRPRRREAQ
jgi:hypothetical protein